MNWQNTIEGEVLNKYPLLEQLHFQYTPGGSFEQLPAIIGVLASMTSPNIAGDTCVLLPSCANASFLVGIISALTANKTHYPERLREYIEEGFQEGDHVRIVPQGDVYVFGGYFSHEGAGKFFKLQLLDDKTNASITFPIHKAVRLEKTNAVSPRGMGKGWGEASLSKLDMVLGTKTFGNHCLFSNEIMLVATKNEFLNFLENTYISRSENEELSVPLSEVIPWGTVTPDGEIEFGNNAATEGQPIIAVSSRLEYVAAACRANQDISPRVIVDGAKRIKDLQAFDDVVDYSKLLVMADHSQVEELSELADRECMVWKVPDGEGSLIGRNSSLLGELQEKYYRASTFELVSHRCESEMIDGIALRLLNAEKTLKDEDVDESIKKIISIAFSRLLDLSAILHSPQKGEFFSLLESVEGARQALDGQKTWIPQEAFVLIAEALDNILIGFTEESEEYRIFKQIRFLEEVDTMQERGKNFAIVCPNSIAVSSVNIFLTENSLADIVVQTIPEHVNGPAFDEVILTGWPRSQNFSKIANCYNSEKISCLSYGIEHKWFTGAARKRTRLLSKWRGDEDIFRVLTGLKGNIRIDTEQLPGSSTGDEELFDEISELETQLSQIRKGTKAEIVSQSDSRDAKYVGFEGRSYAYLAQDRKIPKVTKIVNGDKSEEGRVPLVTADELRIGDYVLWRAHSDSDKDMVRLIAEQGMGEGKYEALREHAGSWKKCLNKLANTPHEVWEKLTEAGLNKIEVTVHQWINHEDRIGPGHLDDLHIIAMASGDKEFEKSVPEIWQAIRTIRGSHIEAGNKLSRLLVKNLPNQLPELSDEETLVDLTLDDLSIGAVWVLKVEMISSDYEIRPYWDVNRLLSDEL